MEEFLVYHKRMFLLTGIVTILAAVGIAIALPGDHARFWGFVIGAAAQLFKFGLLDVSTIKQMAASPDHAAKIQLRATLLGMAVFGVAVVLVFVLGFDVWTMAAGIFLPRIILLVDTFIRPNPFGDKTEGENRSDDS